METQHKSEVNNMTAVRQHKGESGAVLTFSVIAVMLAVLLVGAVYVVKNRGEQVRQQQAITAADQEARSQEQTKQSDEADKNKVSNPNVATDGQTSPSTQSDSAAVAQGSTYDELPQTGSMTALPTAFVMGLVTFMVVSYYSSRRMLQRSL